MRAAFERWYLGRFGRPYPDVPGNHEWHLEAWQAAYRQALEDAAKTAEDQQTCLMQNGSFFSERVATAIRALKEKINE